MSDTEQGGTVEVNTDGGDAVVEQDATPTETTAENAEPKSGDPAGAPSETGEGVDTPGD